MQLAERACTGPSQDLVDFFGFEQKPAEDPEAPHAGQRANDEQAMHCSYTFEHLENLPCQ